MPSPPEDLTAVLADADGFEGINLYSAPVETIAAPALVIRPDTPWLEPDRFCADVEHYLALVAVPASYPQDGISLMRSVTLAMIRALPEGWVWVSTDGPVIDETTGSPFLVNRTRLTFNNGEEEGS